MTDTPEPTPTDDDAPRRAEAKAKITSAVEAVKAELSARLDQLLDELGALI